MDHFFDYSKYYNLLYQDKNYLQEVDYVDSLIKTFYPQTKKILDLGCGTGRHAKLMAGKNYSVHGVDLSQQMLDIANTSKTPNVSFSQGDIRNFELREKFDTITALFHVMSYQTSNESVVSSFKTVHKHLADSGVFIFDFWYGPAVMLDLPGLRVKEMEDDNLKVIRVSKPILDFDKCVVEVNFEVNVFDKKNHTLQTIHEKHPMRYFFQNELIFFANSCGFEVLDFYAWLTTSVPDKNSWYVTVICRKQS